MPCIKFESWVCSRDVNTQKPESPNRHKKLFTRPCSDICKYNILCNGYSGQKSFFSFHLSMVVDFTPYSLQWHLLCFFFFGLLKYCDSGWIYTAHKKYTPRKQPWHRAYFAAMHHGLYITTGQSITSPFRPTVVASFKQEKAGNFSSFVLL